MRPLEEWPVGSIAGTVVRRSWLRRTGGPDPDCAAAPSPAQRGGLWTRC